MNQGPGQTAGVIDDIDPAGAFVCAVSRSSASSDQYSSIIGVLTQPGAIALTRMPVSASSLNV